MSGVINKGTTYADSGAVTSTNLNAHVDDATFKAAAVDGVSTALSTSTPPAIIVKDGGISTAKLADDSITSVKIADSIALGGNPTTTTQSTGSNNTRIATTAFVKNEIPNQFTPSTYESAESITLPNGLIMKVGTKNVASESSPFTITFGSAFNSSAVFAQVTPLLNSNTLQSACHLKSVSTANVVVAFDTDVTELHYMVIGR